jgi:hypothetical protein
MGNAPQASPVSVVTALLWRLRAFALLLPVVGLTLLCAAEVSAATPTPTPGPTPTYKLYGLDFSPYMDGQDPNQGSQISEAQLRARMGIIAPTPNGFGPSVAGRAWKRQARWLTS